MPPEFPEQLTAFYRSLSPHVRNVAAGLLEILYPPKCTVCGLFLKNRPVSGSSVENPTPDSLITGFDRVLAPFVCPSCRKGVLPLTSPMCTVCSEMFKSRVIGDHVCGKCIRTPKNFRIARSVVVYNQPLMDILHHYKYNGDLRLADPMGSLLFETFLRYWPMGTVDIITPVPLHSGKFRKRGFNQAWLLLRSWDRISRSMGIDLSAICFDPLILKRIKGSKAQVGRGRRQRQENIRGVFFVRTPQKIVGKQILVIDDVYTTGATANEIAGTLKKAGAAHVDILTFARTMLRGTLPVSREEKKKNSLLPPVIV